MKFFNVKKRETVIIDDSKCEKLTYKRETSKGTQERYAVKAVDDDGTKVMTFISKEGYDALQCKEEKTAKKKTKKK